MKVYLNCVGMIVALVFTQCLADFASAQGSSKSGNSSRSESKSFTRGSSSTSSSISFKKDGKKVSIQENGSGVTVTVNGESVRARNLEELKQKYPDAYQLYAQKPGSAIASGSGFARGSGSGSSSSSKGSNTDGVKTKSSESKNRSVTVIDNGEKATISENASGITVEVGGKIIRARSVKELKKKNAKAYKLYEKHLKKVETPQKGTDPTDSFGGKLDGRPTAKDLLREKLKEMRNEKSGDPRFQDLFKRMMKEIDK